MLKKTVYLTADEQDGIRRTAAERGISEDEALRALLDAGLEASVPQWDLLPVIDSPELAALGDDLLTRDERDFRPLTPLQGGAFRLLPKDR